MTGKELYPLMKGAGQALPELNSAKGGVLSDVWYGLIGDRVAAWRLRNAADLNETLGKELAKRGTALNLDTIPERFAFKWFEKATEEDEPEIQELFAKLLTNAAEGNEEALTRRNVELVSQMSPKDAELFQKLVESMRAVQNRFQKPSSRQLKGRYAEEGIKWQYNHTAHMLSDDGFTSYESFDHLVAIGVLRDTYELAFDNHRIAQSIGRSLDGRSSFPNLNRATKNERYIQMTRVGDSLAEALYPVVEEE